METGKYNNALLRISSLSHLSTSELIQLTSSISFKGFSCVCHFQFCDWALHKEMI